MERLHVARLSCDFRFCEGQEEEIHRDYLQIASYIQEKESAQLASRMEANRSQDGVGTHFSAIGKEKTDDYSGSRT